VDSNNESTRFKDIKNYKTNMACVINSGYSLGCRDSVGGLEWVAISAYNSGTTYSIGTTFSVNSFSPTASFYKFEQFPEQGGSTQEGAFDNLNGTGFYTQNVTIILEKMDTATRAQFLVLTQARVRIIVKTQNGRYFLIGQVNGARASAGSAGPGTAFGDLAGFSITFEAKEPTPAVELEPVFAASLIV
jgi:hypothetical protein